MFGRWSTSSVTRECLELLHAGAHAAGLVLRIALLISALASAAFAFASRADECELLETWLPDEHGWKTEDQLGGFASREGRFVRANPLHTGGDCPIEHPTPSRTLRMQATMVNEP